MSVINTNITSMIGQANLQKSQSALQTSMERLSSGLRINSAKDDAAGQAIANRMTAQITGLAQAQRNANDGISIAQTAEGSLNQINDNVQRIRELTVQAQNGTNSQDDLDSIQNEINQRRDEINRISEETNFNGVNVLASDQGLKIQVGANDGETITVNLEAINAETLGLSSFNVNGSATIDNAAATELDLRAASNVVVGGTPDAPTFTLQQENRAATAADVLGQVADTQTVAAPGLEAALGFNDPAATVTGFTSDGEGNFSYNATGATNAEAINLITGNADGPTSATYTFDSGSQEILVNSDGNITDKEGNQLYLTTGGNLTLNNGGTDTEAATATNLAAALANSTITGNELVIEGGPTLTAADTDQFVVTGATVTGEQLATLAADNNVNITAGTYSINGADGAVTDGGVAAYVDAEGALTTDETVDTELFVRENNDGIVTDATGVQYYIGEDGALTTEATTTAERTEDPLAALDTALNKIDTLRSELGAVQNRFEDAITNLNTNETNLAAARSRIEDADYAVEVANMTRAQILQQAGTSVLAQANQIPQNVLSLLG
ncbi:flagellin N-terminal helical domain-containing protein [Vreelandella aquamarina]|uniref:flagellin N-terminal helical domain-containing protein n=1 Tax=Vreelandella aquamarina TaxID=77097 RepID=UPI00078520F8|nr:flagellin [Halomonas axialensis]